MDFGKSQRRQAAVGSYASGRYRIRNAGCLDHALCISLWRCRRIGVAKPGSWVSGTLTWLRNDRPIGSISVSFDMRDAITGGQLVISGRVNDEPFRQRLCLVTTPCEFGGHRWWIVCPVKGIYCDAVAFAHGRWASRQAQRLTYGSQSETRLDRIYRAREKAKDRAFGESNYPKPRGDRRRRLVGRWIELEETADDLFAVTAIRRFGRFGLDL